MIRNAVCLQVFNPEEALLIHCTIEKCEKRDATSQKQQAREMKAAKKKAATDSKVELGLQKVAGWQKDQQHLEET